MNKSGIVGLDACAERRAFEKNEKKDNDRRESCEPDESVAHPSMVASYLPGNTQE